MCKKLANIHFIEAQGIDKSHDWHEEIQDMRKDTDMGKNFLNAPSNTIWAQFKRWLLEIIKRDRL